MRLLPYLRVSTAQQAEEGLGLQAQLAAIEALAAREGHTLLPPVQDVGISGASDLDHRSGLALALARLSDGDADGLAIFRLDRLARDLVVQEQLLAEIWQHGVILSCDAGESNLLDPDSKADPSRTMVRQILGAVAQYERALIKLRLAAGRARKREAGGYAGGRPAYGWQALDRELTAAPTEAEVLADIQRLRADGATLAEIAASLEARRVPAPGGGSTWHRTTISRLLHRQ